MNESIPLSKTETIPIRNTNNFSRVEEFEWKEMEWKLVTNEGYELVNWLIIHNEQKVVSWKKYVP